MDSKKITSYLLYAIGEIVLVVIGILIAVSINNWNAKKVQSEKEITYLKALSKEFQLNQERLNSSIRVNKRNLKSARKLSVLIGSTPNMVPIDTLRKMCLGVINAEAQYRPSNGVINEIINSGKLELFRDDSIRFMISGWEGELLKVRFQEKEEVAVTREKLFEVIMGKIIAKEMAQASYNNMFGITKSKLSSDEYALLSSLALENNLVRFITSSYWLDGRYQRLYDYQKVLINRIEKNLKNI